MAGGDQPTAVLPDNLGLAKTEMVNTPQREGIGPALARGDRLGRYVIVERLGAGGMGIVYRAHDPELDRYVAIKVLNIGVGSTAGDYRARLVREGQALAKVSHPNVIAIYDVGEKGRDVFIAMELVEGKSMRQWLRGERHPFAEVVRVFVAAGRGLAAAHAVGLVHRDFKPENVIIGNDGRVRVLDFGIARVAQGKDEPDLADGSLLSPSSGNQLQTPLTHAGAVVGTPLYMAPEQHLSLPVTEAADQFSFCVSLWEALYGKPPFTITDETDVMKLEPEKPAARADVPAWLYPLLRRGLHSDARERFPSMQALVDQLEQKFDADRSKRRMRVVLAGGALAVVSAAGITALVVAKRPAAVKEAAVCAAADMHLAGVWDNNVGAAVEKSFLASKRKYAADMWTRVDGALDRYAGAWTQMRKQACEATHVRKEQSPELLDLRMECLDRRLGELRSLTTLLTAADAEVVDRAVSAALQLTPLDGCADSKRLREAAPLPDNPEQRNQIEAVRAKLGDVIALRSAGKMSDALVLAEKVAASARATNYRPVEAEALYWLGELQVDLGSGDESVKTLEAASVAAEAGRHDEIRARIAIALIYVQADQANFPAAYVAAERAAAMIERLGGDAKLEGKRLSELGNALWSNGRYPEAREKLLAALALQERTLGADHHEVSATLINLGNVTDDLKQYEEAIGYYNRALAIREKAFGAEHPSVSAALNNLGAVALHQKKIDEARTYYERALAIRETVFGPEHPLVAQSLNNIGDAIGTGGDIEGALTYFERALALREKLLPPDHPQLATTIYNVASVHMERKRPAKAVPLFERNLQILAKQMPADHPEVADAHYQLARAYRDSGKRTEAKKHFAAALEAWKKNPPDPAQLKEAQAGAR